MAKDKNKELWEKLEKFLDKSDKIMKVAAWAGGAYLIFETARKAREIPAVQWAGTFAAKLEEIFLGKSLAPAPAEWTAEDELHANIQWAIAAMVGSYIAVEHGGDLIRGLLPL